MLHFSRFLKIVRNRFDDRIDDTQREINFKFTVNWVYLLIPEETDTFEGFLD